MAYKYINEKEISELLFNEPEHVIEFCEAGVISFTEFRDNFSRYLLSRNLEGLRKAGHKIRPGAQLMGADIIIDKYERARDKLDAGEASDEHLRKSAKQMNELCSTVIGELQDLAKRLTEQV